MTKLEWVEKQKMDWTLYAAQTDTGKTYEIEKEDEWDYLIFLDAKEIGGATSLAKAKFVAQHHFDQIENRNSSANFDEKTGNVPF